MNRADTAVGTAAIAQIGYSRRADDYYAAAVLTELLKETVKAPGASVEIEANPRVLAGPIIISASAPQDHIAAVVQSILDEVSKFQSASLPAEKIEAAKTRLVSQMSERLQGNDETAEVILEIELYELGRDYLLNFATRVNAVTAGDVQKAAQTYLKPQSVAIAVAATEDKVKESLMKLGPVSVMK
jgi:predicted Zn-dependent peptidase